MLSLRSLSSVLLALILVSNHGAHCQRQQSSSTALRVRRMIEDGVGRLLTAATTGGGSDSASTTTSSTSQKTAGYSAPTSTKDAGDDDSAGDDDATDDDATATGGGGGGGGGGASTATGGDTTADTGSSSGSTSTKDTTTKKESDKNAASTKNYNDDDDGYPTMSGNITSNQDFVRAPDDDEVLSPADEVLQDLTERSESMPMSKKEGIVAAIVLVVLVAAVLGVKLAKNCKGRRAGYRRVGEIV